MCSNQCCSQALEKVGCSHARSSCDAVLRPASGYLCWCKASSFNSLRVSSVKELHEDWMMEVDSELDVLTYTIFLSPTCLIVFMVGAAVTWKAESLDEFCCMGIIIPNGYLAFTMNVTVSLLIKNCSAFAFVLTGRIKDVVGETAVAQK